MKTNSRRVTYWACLFSIIIGFGGCYLGSRDAAAFARQNPNGIYDSPIPGFAFLLGWAGVFALATTLVTEPSTKAKASGILLFVVAAVPAVAFAYVVLTTN